MRRRQTVHDHAAAYALDALDDDDRIDFERHLQDCDRCQDELPSLQDAASALAYAAEAPAPPAELRERILETARDERTNVVPLRRRRLLRPAVWVAAAAAAVIVGLLVWSSIQSNRLRDEQSARRAESRALVILADPEATRAPLTGYDGTLAVRDDGQAALAVANLDKAPRGRTYEAWVIVGGTNPQRAGLFGGGGGTTATVVLQRPVPRGATVAVTIERKGGVAAPTTRPIMTASLPPA